MPAVKAVLDTNVLVSAFLKGNGREALIFSLACARRFIPAVSDLLLREYEEVLTRPGFGFNAQKIRIELSRFLAAAFRAPTNVPSVHAAYDPADDMVLDCALASGASYLVTGNTRHFPPQFETVRILPPRDFLLVLAASLA